jgi:hypothetical protein
MGNGALLDAIDALEPAPYEHAIIEKFECLDRLFATVLADLDRFDRDRMWEVCGATSLRNWLTTSCNRTGREAGSSVSMMRLLRSLPHTSAAFADGSLAKAHVEVISANVNNKTIGEFVDAEKNMVPLLADLSINDTTTVMKRWAEQAKAAVGDRHKPRPENEADHLFVSELLDNQFKVDGILNGPDGHVFKAGLAVCMPEPVEGEPVRTFAQRQAEALVEMARRVLQTTNTTARRSTDAIVLIPFETFANGGVASYADGTNIAPAIVQRLLCDAVITPMIQGDTGQPLWLGRSKRTASDAQRRALVGRDRHCAFPNCHRPASWTDVHHVNWWDRDHGPTDIDNLCLLCTRHHTLLHQPGWHAKLTPEQTLEITTPTGRVLTAPPRTRIHDTPKKPCRQQPNNHAPPPVASLE